MTATTDGASPARPTFVSPTDGQVRHEWVVMQRFGDTWGATGITVPRGTREAAEQDLARVNWDHAATIARLEADLANPNYGNEGDRDFTRRYLASLTKSEYAIFTRTITPYVKADPA